MTRLKLSLGFAACILITCAPRPSQAAPASTPTAEQLAALSNHELGSRVSALKDREMTPELWCELAAYSGEAARRKPLKSVQAAAALAQGFCAEGKNDFALAIVEWTRAEELFGESAQPELRMQLDASILLAAARSMDGTAYALHLRHIAERGWPDEYARAYVDLWEYGFQLLDSDQSGPISLVFVRSAAFTSLPEDLRSLIAARAVKPAIAAGEIELAARMATILPDPQFYQSVLIDRAYEPIWPKVEASAGPRLKLALVGAVAHAREQLAAKPGDEKRRTALALALLQSSDLNGIIAMAESIERAKGANQDYSEQDAWVLNYQAKALDALGRRAEADAVFDRIGLLSAEGDRGWVVNFAINRAVRLVHQGRWREALPASEYAISIAGKHGNEYGRQIAAASRYCAAYKLQPLDPALEPAWAAIKVRALDSIGASVMAALCKGDNIAARQFVRAGLEDATKRAYTLELLQPREFELYPRQPSAIPDASTLLNSDPQLKVLFHKYGRQLPAELLPN